MASTRKIPHGVEVTLAVVLGIIVGLFFAAPILSEMPWLQHLVRTLR